MSDESIAEAASKQECNAIRSMTSPAPERQASKSLLAALDDAGNLPAIGMAVVLEHTVSRDGWPEKRVYRVVVTRVAATKET